MATLVPPVPPLKVVLVPPQIPPNTGNVARTCAVTGTRLHLVEPLGCSLAAPDLLRAGLDDWEVLDPRVYRDWADFEARALEGQSASGVPVGRLHLFTGRAERPLLDVAFAPLGPLVPVMASLSNHGHEQAGAPAGAARGLAERQVGIPMLPGQRSLILAVAAGVAVYAALASIARGGRGVLAAPGAGPPRACLGLRADSRVDRSCPESNTMSPG